jgi:hypothetical protein
VCIISLKELQVLIAPESSLTLALGLPLKCLSLHLLLEFWVEEIMLKELLRGPSLRRIQVEAFLDKVQCEVVFLQAWKNFFEWP